MRDAKVTPGRLATILLFMLLALPAREITAEDCLLTCAEAAFVVNVARYVEWPAKSFATADSPLVVGIFGDQAKSEELKDIIGQHTINGRAMVARPLAAAEEARDVHLVLITGTSPVPVGQIEDAIAWLPVITVVEASPSTHSHGIFTIKFVHGKIHFDLDLRTATRAGLTVGYPLQLFASEVVR